jgi:proteasome lid subunit RPN8/RPN11
MSHINLIEIAKPLIISHAEEFPASEVCGLVLKDGTVVRSDNMIEGSGLSEDGVELTTSTGVLLDEDLIIEFEQEIAIVYHTHVLETQEGWLSFADIEQSRFHQIPYLLYHTAFKTWDYFDPDYCHPFPLLEKTTPKKNINYYLGWPFIFSRSDCATLMRAYCENVLNHSIPDYHRPRDGQWYRNDSLGNSYLDLFQDPVNGFTLVNTSTPKKNDVVLMRFFGSRHPCHVGVMVEEDKMLHLLEPGHLSEVTIWGGAWKRGLHSVWRIRGR